MPERGGRRVAPGEPGEREQGKHVWKGEEQLVWHGPSKRLEHELKRARRTEQRGRDDNTDR